MLNWFKKKIQKKNVEENPKIEELQDDIQQEQQEKENIDSEQTEVTIDNNILTDNNIPKEEEEVIEEIVEELVEEIYEEPQEEIETEVPEETPIEKPAKKKMSLFEKLKNGLTKTRNDMSNKIEDILNSYKKVDEELFEDLEEALVTADVGATTTMEIIDRLKDRIKKEKVNDPLTVKELLKDEIKILMKESVSDNTLKLDPLPAVILVVGVNGVGKTTTIGKLSHSFKEEGKKVLIAAGDTFRAAAIEQLEEWANRSKAEIIAHTEGADPAAVVFDGIQAAKARKSDILICDTAGRLHNKSNLMNELNKIFRVVDREYPDATKEVLLVLDATTGQNAINQAKVFKEVANLTGVALTKLDGTAKGGVIIALQSELNLPVKLVGVGEGIDDLQPFIVDDFVEAIFD
ncbi:signal recognition particle-docking protein FtsY [Tissierella sp. Yu-01]|uniref:signal recognition particle-docking protein FtsY n=1 Tax=Tissierella sp. Yu-01 TaxID=3035694 RepID=UPI00240E01FE|nr:signal recognition particle-docking protein FtsY [Tissierella sp. Yu-01]WFA09787.1 signal recognition particle-docking protein FtsY [Tissierella sp. Yu-01]